ncbi:MAG: TolC family protein [Terriglobales bacterium]
MTLGEALRLALSSSSRMEAAAAMQRGGEAQVREARSGYWPQVDLAEDWTRSDDPVFAFGARLRQRRFTAADFDLARLNQPGPVNDLQSQLNLRWTLWDARQTEMRVRRAELGVQATQREREQTQQEVLQDTLAAYWRLSASLAQQTVAASAVTAAAAATKDATSRYRQGLTVQADQLSAEVELSSARARELEAEAQVSMARAGLNRLLGRAQDSDIRVQPLIAGDLAEPSQLQVLLAAAQAHSPQLQAETARTAMAATEVTRARAAAHLPTLSSLVQWQRDQPTWTGNGQGHWTAAVHLQLSLFRGGADQAAIASALEQEIAANALQRDLQSQLELTIRQAWYAAEAARAQVGVSRQASDQAAAALRILQTRYANGLTTLTDLLQAQAAQVAAQSRQVEALYRWQLSQARTQAAAGLLSPETAAHFAQPAPAHSGSDLNLPNETHP